MVTVLILLIALSLVALTAIVMALRHEKEWRRATERAYLKAVRAESEVRQLLAEERKRPQMAPPPAVSYWSGYMADPPQVRRIASQIEYEDGEVYDV